MIRASLTPEQTEALRAALRDVPWQDHSVDMRVTLPVPFRPFYLTLVGDPERRSAGRRSEERVRHPFWKLGNILFIVIGALVLYGIAIAGVLLYSAILDR